MSNTTDYTGQRTGLKDFLISKLSWADATNVYDYSPTDPATVFGNLPAIIVDFDRRYSNAWVEGSDGRYAEGVTYLIEIYEEIDPTDTSGGRDSSESIAGKIKEIEDLFRSEPSVQTLVKTSTIRASKVEPIIVEITQILGIKVRFGWVSLQIIVIR